MYHTERDDGGIDYPNDATNLARRLQGLNEASGSGVTRFSAEPAEMPVSSDDDSEEETILTQRVLVGRAELRNSYDVSEATSPANSRDPNYNSENDSSSSEWTDDDNGIIFIIYSVLLNLLVSIFKSYRYDRNI